MSEITYAALEEIVQQWREAKTSELQAIIKVANALVESVADQLDAPPGLCRIAEGDEKNPPFTEEDDGRTGFAIETVFADNDGKEVLWVHVNVLASIEGDNVRFEFLAAGESAVISINHPISERQIPKAARIAISSIESEIEGFASS